MQWLLIVGGIIYYLYRAYQQESQKNVNKPLTPVNKPIRHAPKKTSEEPEPEIKTLEDVWKELKKAAQKAIEPPLSIPKPIPQIVPEKNITNKQYDTMFSRTSILDQIPVEEGGAKSMSEMTAVNADYEDKIISKKFFVINGKMLSPKDTFIASMIWERKV